MLHHRITVCSALLLAVQLQALPAAAQTIGPQPGIQSSLEPGLGVLQSFALLPVSPGATTLRFADLQDKGRVRGLRIVASPQAGCIIENVTVTYSTGQVHTENRVIALLAGERSAV